MSKKIVQIGANKGNTDNDPVWKLCQENLPSSLNWYLYFVEPNPKAVDILKESYKKFNHVDILPYAVTDTPIMTDAQLYIDNDDSEENAGSQHCSLIKGHLLNHNHSEDVISSIRVLSFNLNDIFTLFGITDEVIDYLQIDTEGYDGKILLGADLCKLNINVIEYEHIHLSGTERNDVHNKLVKDGYKFCWIKSEDTRYEKII